jgi:transposase
VSNKFKHLVGDLRKSWEEEEASRAKQLEERLRSHYSAVLEHMESQLQMALKLQDEADRQWMEDVEARNKQQVKLVCELYTTYELSCDDVDTRGVAGGNNALFRGEVSPTVRHTPGRVCRENRPAAIGV